MRSRLILAVFAMNLTGVAWADYEEVRELTLDADGIDTLSIDAGAGSMDVVGESGLDQVIVTATIEVSGRNDDKARERIENDMELGLEKDGDTAELRAWFDSGGFTGGGNAHIQLEVRMPEGMNLEIDDGSGSIEIENVRGDVSLDDGSGSVTMRDVGGAIDIEDGSGSITLVGAGGDVNINDGSGSIDVRGVAGSVTVDDGSGGIDISDVEEDLIIVDDGSGGLDFSNIGGKVEKES